MRTTNKNDKTINEISWSGIKDAVKTGLGMTAGVNTGAARIFTKEFVENAINDISLALQSGRIADPSAPPSPDRPRGPGGKFSPRAPTTESRYEKLDRIFESLVDEASYTAKNSLATYVLQWVRQYTAGMRMGDWATDRRIRQLASQVQLDWTKDKGKNALTQMSNYIWASYNAGMGPNGGKSAAAPKPAAGTKQIEALLAKLKTTNPTEYAALISKLTGSPAPTAPTPPAPTAPTTPTPPAPTTPTPPAPTPPAPTPPAPTPPAPTAPTAPKGRKLKNITPEAPKLSPEVQKNYDEMMKITGGRGLEIIKKDERGNPIEMVQTIDDPDNPEGGIRLYFDKDYNLVKREKLGEVTENLQKYYKLNKLFEQILKEK